LDGISGGAQGTEGRINRLFVYEIMAKARGGYTAMASEV
jgi:hypothetical protein